MKQSAIISIEFPDLFHHYSTWVSSKDDKEDDRYGSVTWHLPGESWDWFGQ